MTGAIGRALTQNLEKRALRKALGKAGVRLPSSVSVLNDLRGVSLLHPFAASQVENVDPYAPLPDAIIENAARLTRMVRHGEKWNRELADRGIELEDATDGSRIVHPLALRLIMDDVQRGIGPTKWETGRPGRGRIRDVRWRSTDWGAILVTTLLLGEDDDAKSVFSFLPKPGTPAVAQYAAAIPMPETIAAACAGRRLVEIVAIPDSGEPDIDASVAGLRIANATPTRTSTVFTLEPATWLGWTGDPAWAQWHQRNAYCA